MRWLFFLVILTSLFSTASAQVPDRSGVERAIQYLELEKAAQLSLALPADKDAPYYQSRIAFLGFLTTEAPEKWERFIKLSKVSLQTLDQLPDQDPEKRVMMAELFFLRGVGKMMEKRYVASAFDIKSACNLLDKNQSQFPDNMEQRKLLGIFHVAMSAIPRKLRWLSNALCFRGDLETGMQYLRDASENSRLMAAESEVMRYYFEKNLLNQPEQALSRIESLLAKHPGSVVYSYLKLSALLEARKIDQALEFCAVQEPIFLKNTEAEELHLWYYSRAKAHYFRLEFEAAIENFDHFLDRYQGKTLYSDALFRKGMSLVLQDRYPEARRVFHQMANIESSTFDEDEYATHMASIYRFKEPSSLDKDLFRARNLFDGGFYEASLDILNILPEGLNQNQQAERHYRLGRNYQALDRPEAAQKEYLASTQTTPGQSLWMKVYAHYYLGQIADRQGRLKEAKTWYEKALDYNGYEYQSGLEQRSKAALQQLKSRKDTPPQ